MEDTSVIIYVHRLGVEVEVLVTGRIESLESGNRLIFSCQDMDERPIHLTLDEYNEASSELYEHIAWMQG